MVKFMGSHAKRDRFCSLWVEELWIPVDVGCFFHLRRGFPGFPATFITCSDFGHGGCMDFAHFLYLVHSALQLRDGSKVRIFWQTLRCQTWHLRTPIKDGCMGKWRILIYKWCIFHCHVWLPEGMSVQKTVAWPSSCRLWEKDDLSWFFRNQAWQCLKLMDFQWEQHPKMILVHGGLWFLWFLGPTWRRFWAPQKKFCEISVVDPKCSEKLSIWFFMPCCARVSRQFNLYGL